MELRNDNIIEIWEMFSEIISPDKRNDAALTLVEYLQQNGYDLDDLKDLKGQDDYFDFAITQLGIDDEDRDTLEYEDF
jgi:hypothetical protein